MNKRTRAAVFCKTVLAVILMLGALVWILPFVWMILSSFKTDLEIMQFPPSLIPENPIWDNFKDLFQSFDFLLYLKNTLIVVVCSFGGMLLNAMAGFGFAKYKFKGRETLFYLVLATMMIPGQVIMIPVYLIMNGLGLTNTMPGIVLPGLVGAYGIFLFRQFISNISDELLAAARIDGASEWYIFTRIILPVSKPILAVSIIRFFTVS